MSDSGAGWDVKETAEWSWDNYDKIRKRLAELVAWLSRSSDRAGAGVNDDSRPGILIVGPQGVGKSTFARLITNAAHPFADAPVQYEESIGVESYTLKLPADDGEIELVVLPGQEHRRADSWPEVLHDVGQGEYRGVILFSAFGHHALGDTSYKSHALYEKHGKRKTAFLNAYLAQCRENELAVVRKLEPHLKACPVRLWLLSIVTKQDLWWKDRVAAEEHYQRGDYSAIIDEVRQQRGAANLRHELTFVSLVIRRLMTGRGETLKNNVAGYDQESQLRSLRNLATTIDSLRKWDEQI